MREAAVHSGGSPNTEEVPGVSPEDAPVVPRVPEDARVRDGAGGQRSRLLTPAEDHEPQAKHQEDHPLAGVVEVGEAGPEIHSDGYHST